MSETGRTEENELEPDYHARLSRKSLFIWLIRTMNYMSPSYYACYDLAFDLVRDGLNSQSFDFQKSIPSIRRTPRLRIDSLANRSRHEISAHTKTRVSEK